MAEAKNCSSLAGKTVAVVSLGCAKNRIDSEEILGRLTGSGLIFTDNLDGAAVIIVNTCAFTDEAKEESIAVMRRLVRRRRGRYPIIVAAGCLAQRWASHLARKMPELDAVVGVNSYEDILSLLERCGEEGAGQRVLVQPPPAGYRSLGPRLLTTPPYSAYLKIAEGCSNRCHYCVIPSIRGPYRSRPPEDILQEAEQLIRLGARELNLVAQDITLYGRDLPVKTGLVELVRKLVRLPGLTWLRLLYAYPTRVEDDLLRLLAEEEKLCPYLDIPLQHVEDQVLAAMGRPYGREDVLDLLSRIERISPGVVLRTTLMVGHPGETREMFARLMDFIRRHPFDHLGVFSFSPQEGTVAAGLQPAVPRRVRERRRRELMQLQQRIALGLKRRYLGRELAVLVEGRNRRGYYYGRTAFQAPEVDGKVFWRSRREIPPGELVAVKITGITPYDLVGIFRGRFS
ncbi:MAG TPA: 30S ribosomal protein S12 methylthiotransferase RimO [Bacillota bacterium]|jgi:ribosomal protein S12 methylthiotransferase|nr:30S ribosomal protein S12 methylthiotransferase RimO [Bacillota bacterium]HOB87407.1 30S ribosomal protein S12 methylthiotransferase RimO [Bacillota bacterium]HOP68474.1 30S ribosomal protein S12 methylthiotransferase RimO [Bacillota bacterium]HPT33579.1 30S ribosomal protein S12 methylthiotransferase RimO [Bacillota bacterium]HPZ64076.1 30S ribosomal protein S12 methylthiotransferase RimO [Bacillota bacterium]